MVKGRSGRGGDVPAPGGMMRDLPGLAADQLRARALDALHQRRFDLADEVLASGDLKIAALVENLRIYQVELELQNDELRHSQLQTQEMLERFTTFFNSLPVAELVIDRTGLVKEANHAAQRLFHLRDTHFHQHFFARLIDEADRGTVIGAWSGLSANQSTELTEIRFQGGETGHFIGDLHLATLPRSEGAVQQFVCAVIDRTETVQQRLALHEAGIRLRRSEAELHERLKELACLHDVLAATMQPDVPLEQVLQQVVERLPAAWLHPHLAEARIELPDIRRQDAAPTCVETAGFVLTEWSQTAHARPDGRYRVTITIIYREAPPHAGDSPFLVEEQDLLDAVASHVAVFLARHEDEERLRESRERYRVLAQYSPDWEYWLAPDGSYRYVSPACARLTGYEAGVFLADPGLMLRLLHPSDREVWMDHLKSILATEGMTPDADCLEFRIRSRDGQERWIEHICSPVVTEDGRYLGRRGVNRDITERKRFEEELKRSEDFLNVTGHMAKVGGWEVDATTHAVRWTRGAHELFEMAPDGKPSFENVLAFFHPSDRSRLEDAVAQALAHGQEFDMQMRLMTAQDHSLWAQVTGEPVWEHGRVVKLLGTIQDITARMEADKSLRQAARVFESTAEGVLITDPDARILAVNRAFTEVTGYAEEEVLGKTPRLLQSGRHDAAFYQAMRDELKRTGQWRGEIWNRHKNGQIYPELLTVSAVLDQAGELTQYVGVFRDISHIKRSEERLEYQAHHDSLTALPNRSLFQARLEQCLQRAARYGRLVGLLFLDLDRFKEVNDTLGHPVGDALLQQVADTLAKEVRAADTIARLGGDEFVVILDDIPAASYAARFAERLLAAFRRPFQVKGHELFITASMGVSVYPQDGTEIDTLIRHADVAMYQTKNSGRNGFSFYDSTMSEGAGERLRLEQDLRGAVQRHEFILHYQPQLALGTRELRGVEVLCRWHHPRLGLLSPDQFIRMAEEIGVIDELGAWVLEQSCRQMARWDREGFRVPRLAVNLSVREIERADLVDQIKSILQRTGIAPQRLELEVTESMIMRRADAAIATLMSLRALGVTLAVDDFGTGYSSLAYLKRLPLHRLKIDRSFVEKLTEDSNDDAIVRAIIALGRSLGLETLAEGVETQEQADFLCREGCDEGQGYLFSRSATAATLAAGWLV
ncbi:PAS domain S-box-containing protein/diguanylate cyclase (GGDEF)-like protein [Thiobaca trueperi]|uniref:cyclic-guanylate-specific phosphodiesterase n=2 Tax=Thiobaca trueperi TaxID=127458 RepID=A0A4R3MZL1_9GAMM|nr:PAS domain S-box-containing protein/diguanylate cyclase (GGDEF)-like protein [Thiobaca trueperi]